MTKIFMTLVSCGNVMAGHITVCDDQKSYPQWCIGRSPSSLKYCFKISSEVAVLSYLLRVWVLSEVSAFL